MRRIKIVATLVALASVSTSGYSQPIASVRGLETIVTSDFDEARFQVLFPKARFKKDWCTDGDVVMPPGTEDALNITTDSGDFFRICRSEDGGVSRVMTNSKSVEGIGGLRVGQKWIGGLFRESDCTPIPNAIPSHDSSKPSTKVECYMPTDTSTLYVFDVPPFYHGDGRRPVIKFDKGILTLIQWTRPRLPT